MLRCDGIVHEVVTNRIRPFRLRGAAESENPERTGGVEFLRYSLRRVNTGSLPMSNVTPDQNAQFIETSAALLSAMSNANRLNILTLLSEKEISVGLLSGLVGLSQSALSQHLAKLREASLVLSRRDGQTVYYRCESPAVVKVLATLRGFFDPADDLVSGAA